MSGYGNKAAALKELAGNGYPVPELFAFSHKQIIDLFKGEGVDIPYAWGFIAGRFASSERFVEAIQKGYAPLEVLRQQIIGASRSITFARILQSIITEEFRQFGRFLDSHTRLMVRSSGDEDAAGAANAGGHDSFVSKSDISAVAEHIGKVVASYFAPRGLIQSHQAGTDIRQQRQCSIFCQQLVDTGKEGLVVSGVVYSQFDRTDTPKGIRIDATFGHGEGVVNSSLAIPTDSYFVTYDKVVRSIKQKTHGIFNLNDRLKRLAIPDTAKEQITLTDGQCMELFAMASALHARYGADVDVEFATNVKTGELYLLQCRPAPCRKAAAASSYIEHHTGNEWAASPILQSSSTLQCNASEILYAANLGLALDKFNKLPDEERKAIKLVLVEKDAASTSHEAGQFMAMDVLPVKVGSLSDIDKAAVVTVDPQNKRIVDDPRPSIKQGLMRFPLSRPESFYPYDDKDDSIKFDLSMPFYPIKASLSELFSELRKNPSNPDTQSSILQYARRAYAKTQGFPEAWTLLQNAYRIRIALTKSRDPIESAYHISRLEGIFYQASTPDYANVTSFKSLLQLKTSLGHDIKPSRLNLLMGIGDYIYAEDAQKKYSDFITALFGDENKKWGVQNINKFMKFVAKLHSANMLGNFLNTATSFSIRDIAGNSTVFDDPVLMAADNVVKNWGENVPEWRLATNFKKLHTLFEIEFIPLFIRVLTKCLTKNSGFKTLQRDAYLSTALRMIEAYDLSIKSITSRPRKEITDDELRETAEQFFKLSAPYIAMSDRLLKIITKDHNELITEENAEQYVAKPERLLHYLSRTRLGYIPSTDSTREKLLESFQGKYDARAVFEAKQLNITGLKEYLKITPNGFTREDDFSLAHQFMLNILGKIQDTYLKLPEVPQVREAYEEITSMEPDSVYIEYNYPVIDSTYNKSLRDHSCQLRFFFDVRKEFITKVRISFMMGNECNRARAMMSLAKLISLEEGFDKVEICSSKEASENPKCLMPYSFTFHFDKAPDVTALGRIYMSMDFLTFKADDDDDYGPTFGDWKITPEAIMAKLPTFFSGSLDGFFEILYLLCSAESPDNELILQVIEQALSEFARSDDAYFKSYFNDFSSKLTKHQHAERLMLERLRQLYKSPAYKDSVTECLRKFKGDHALNAELFFRIWADEGNDKTFQHWSCKLLDAIEAKSTTHLNFYLNKCLDTLDDVALFFNQVSVYSKVLEIAKRNTTPFEQILNKSLATYLKQEGELDSFIEILDEETGLNANAVTMFMKYVKSNPELIAEIHKGIATEDEYNDNYTRVVAAYNQLNTDDKFPRNNPVPIRPKKRVKTNDADTSTAFKETADASAQDYLDFTAFLNEMSAPGR